MKPTETIDSAAASRCRLVSLGRFDELRGSLCVAEVGQAVSFSIQRAYWVFDMPPGTKRAMHAHREQSEFLVAVSGGFTVWCDDGNAHALYRLDSPDQGLLLPPMVFHTLSDFAPGTRCLVLASGPYDPTEYVDDHAEFRQLTQR